MICLLMTGTVLTSNEMRFEDSTGCGNNCELCDSETDSCERCRSGYYYNQIARLCEQVGGGQPNCLYNQYKSTCSQCQPGFSLIAGQCVACIQNCKTCDSSTSSCDRCLKGFGNINTNTKTCGLTCGVSNCDQCVDGSSTTCLICSEGYRINTLFQCDKCSVDNCGSCIFSLSACDLVGGVNSCVDGYFLLDGKCEKCDSGCKKCDLSGNCISCDVSNGSFMWMDMKCKKGQIIILKIWGIAFLFLIYFFTV